MRLRIASLLFVGLASLSAPAAAQDAGAARALFERGLAAAHDQRWDDALAAFRSSLEIVERPSTLLNLAGAEAATGHVTDAITSYQRFLEIAPARDAHRRDARAALEAVQARLAHLTLQIEGRQPGDRVSLDERVLLPAALAAPIDVDPGAHTVSIVRGSREIARAHVELADGAAQTLAVAAALPAPTETVTTPIEEPEPAPAEASTGSDDTLWIVLGVCLGAAAVAGVTVGVVLATQPSTPAPYQGNFGMVIRF